MTCSAKFADVENRQKRLFYGVLFGGHGRNRTGVHGFAVPLFSCLLAFAHALKSSKAPVNIGFGDYS